MTAWLNTQRSLKLCLHCSVLCLVTQSGPTPCNPWAVAHQAPLHGVLQARILEWTAMPSSRGSFQPRDQTHVSRTACEFLTILAPGKPKNTGVGSLSLLQGIFPAQELNQGLLHCRQILHQLSHQESPCLLQSIKCVTHYVFKTQCTYLNLRKLYFIKKTLAIIL